MPIFEDYKPYTKEEVCKFLDFLFLKYFSRSSLSDARRIQDLYVDFGISPLTERMLESLGTLETNEKKKGSKTDDKS